MTDIQKECFLRILAEGLFVGLDHPFEAIENHVRTLSAALPYDKQPEAECVAEDAVFTFYKEYVHGKYTPEDPEYTAKAFNTEIAIWYKWRKQRLDDYVRRHNAAEKVIKDA
jgi:hypothetical protein